jgi:hypothetical protein
MSMLGIWTAVCSSLRPASTIPDTVLLPIAKIRTNGGTQQRAEIDQDVIQDYAEILDELPPVTVFEDNAGAYWLADGFHRLKAAFFAGRDSIQCDVRSGSRRDAVLYSVGANARHGLRRSNADKRKAVMTLRSDKEWARWSNQEIARQCAVSQAMVSVLRRNVEGPNPDPNRRRLALQGDRIVSRPAVHAKPETNGHTVHRNAPGNADANMVRCPYCEKTFALD